ncbi:prefoldin subunit 6-like [Ornithodoros turicata]|uniref:prefoldin subunit 6-like n=1 Tax=Ornithodoros turicata TaxID=34597 RepID=UPI003138D78C
MNENAMQHRMMMSEDPRCADNTTSVQRSSLAMEASQKMIAQEAEKFRTIQKEYQKAYNMRQKLEGQLHENTVVKEELDLLEPEATVFKLVGPVLVKQPLDEAKQNVSKRIEYIAAEVKRHDNMLHDLEKKQEAQKEAFQKVEQQFRQQKAALKA